MIELAILIAAAAAVEPASAEPRDPSPITVRGNRIVCRRINTNSAGTRLGGHRVCLTQHEWDDQRDQAVELLEDMPRRNPVRAGRTIPSVAPDQ